MRSLLPLIKSRRLRAMVSVAGQRRRLDRPAGGNVRYRDARDVAARIRPERILILRLRGLGDFIMALPAFQHLRASFPQSSLEILVHSEHADLARMAGLFDTVHHIPFEKQGAERALSRSLAALELGSVDLLIDIGGRRLAAEIPARIKADFESIRAESAEAVGIQIASDGIHMHDRLLMLAAAVTGAFGVQPTKAPVATFPTYRKDRPRDRAELSVLLNPFSSAAIKNWPVEHFAALVEKLGQRQPTRIEIFGSESIGDDADTGAARKALATLPGVVDLGGFLSFDALFDRLTEADVFIGNDTGTTHLAAELGVPTVAIMSGVFDLRTCRPYGPSVAVLNRDVPCAPCHLRHAACPVGHLCMTTISPEAVLMAVDDLLARNTVTAPQAAKRRCEP